MTVVGVDHLTMLDVAPPDWVTLSHGAGFGAVGIRVLAGMPPERQWEMTPGSPMLADTLVRLDDTGMQVHAVEIVRLNPESSPRDYAPLLETGARLGAEFVNVMVDDPDPARVNHAIATLAEAARPYGLRPAVEAMPYMRMRTLQDAADAVRGTAAGIIIDPLHLHRAGLTPGHVSDLDPDLLAYFQLCDAPLAAPVGLVRPERLPNNMSMKGGDLALEARALRLLPGEGDLPLHELMEAKPATLPISVEAPGLPLRRALGDVEYLRRARLSVETLLSVRQARPLSA